MASLSNNDIRNINNIGARKGTILMILKYLKVWNMYQVWYGTMLVWYGKLQVWYGESKASMEYGRFSFHTIPCPALTTNTTA